MKPFIKWAGGKTQLLPDIRSKYPAGLGRSITKYCEPFIGGGAVLFDLLGNYILEEILINDINKELTNTYIQIRDNLPLLLEALEELQLLFWPMSSEERKGFYYDKRNRFNLIKNDSDEAYNIEKAVLFIFLNKTCFNGLFRVNSKGGFNVPMGSYKRPLICDEENLEEVSEALKKVKITTGNYQQCADFIDESTFVYIDPPYRPISETASFTAYSESNFSDAEQVELGRFIDSLSEKKAKILISNSDPKNNAVEDDFFDDLYKEYTITRIFAKRMINSKAENRGCITELLISNY